jgi:hypothetical protein
MGDVASMWTIPTVEEGLALGSRLFTQEMWEDATASGRVVPRGRWPGSNERIRQVAFMHPELVLADELDDQELWESQ